jgi:hypothetical protein
MKKISIALLPLSLLLNNCTTSNEVQLKNKQALYENCMSTFQDEAKCNSFLDKAEADLQTAEEKHKLQVAKLSKEQLAGLKLRSEVKDILPGKNNVYVRNYLGDPDEIKYYGERIYWEYYRPVCKFSPDAEPDEKVTVVFRKVLVERVEHIKPASAIEEGAGFRKILSPDAKTDVKKMNGVDTVK